MRNQADTLVYQTEKLLKEQGEKFEGSEKDDVEAALKGVKDALAGTSLEAIKDATEKLVGVSQSFSQRLYEQASASASAGSAGPAARAVTAPAVAPRRAPRTTTSSTPRSSMSNEPVRRAPSRRRRPSRGLSPTGRRLSEEAAASDGAAPVRRQRRGPAGRRSAAPDPGRDPLESLARERDEYLLALQRTQADFENYRKRITRQQGEMTARAAADLVDKLLPVLDTLDLAEAHFNESLDLTEDGKALRASRAMLMDILSKEGLERVDQRNVPFDPSVHDAVAHTEGAARRHRDDGRRGAALRLPLEGAGAAPGHGPRAGVS